MGSVERLDSTAIREDGPEHFRTLSALLMRRSSCRAFQRRPVPRPSIERMLTVAQMTPSWCNTQPWQVTIVSGVAMQRLRQALLPDFDSLLPIYSAPHALLLHVRREMGAYGALDCGLYLASIVLAAEAMGLDVAALPSLTSHEGRIGEATGITDGSVFVAGAAFGFADKAPLAGRLVALNSADTA